MSKEKYVNLFLLSVCLFVKLLTGHIKYIVRKFNLIKHLYFSVI